MLYTDCTVLQTIWTQIGLLECSFRRMSSCADPEFFVRGGPGPTARKQPGQRCFFGVFFLVLTLIYSLQRGSNVLYPRKPYFSKDPEGVQHFPGGGGGGG